MLSNRTRTRGGLIPHCLTNAAAWLHRHPLAAELLALAAVAGLLALEVLP